MGVVEKIRRPIENEMDVFECKFREMMSSRVKLIDRIMYYIVRRKGKQMRPMFVFLTAKMLGQVNESTYRAAAFIELIHTASLVHDDVVDDADKRRDFFSVNAVWKNKIAVLAGDFMLSQALSLATEHQDFSMLKLIARSGKEMAEGELLQIEKARKLNITEEVYYEVIRCKTATLIATCTAAGALSVGCDEDRVEHIREFGTLCGMAFQIKDDLFDYTDQKIGKPTGIDIREQKMTLPLIYVLNNASKSERKWMIDIVKKHNNDKSKVRELIAFVKSHGGLEYAQAKMDEFKEKALAMLLRYPDNECRQSLVEIVKYSTERNI